MTNMIIIIKTISKPDITAAVCLLVLSPDSDSGPIFLLISVISSSTSPNFCCAITYSFSSLCFSSGSSNKDKRSDKLPLRTILGTADSIYLRFSRLWYSLITGPISPPIHFVRPRSVPIFILFCR